jgi:methionine-rich copper-binding protein CopC
MRRAFALLVLAVIAVLALPRTDALAHARLETANPAPDALVTEPLAELRVWTTQELTLSGNDLVVTDASGLRVDNADARVDQTDPNRKQLVASLQPLAAGAYTVTYTLTSAEDGHSYTDSYVFTVDASAVKQAPVGSAPPAGVKLCPRLAS